MTPDPEERFCLHDKEKLKSPFQDFCYFRQERPVFYHEPMKAWFVFRYEDIDRLFHDPRMSSQRTGGFLDMVPAEARKDMESVTDLFDRWVLMRDGKEHTRVRKILRPSFSHHEVMEWKPRIRQLVEELLDQAVGATRIDIAADFAYPLPVRVIAEMIGLGDRNWRDLLRLSDDHARFFNEPPFTVESTRRMVRSAHELANLIQQIIDQRRNAPGSDLISRLIKSEEGSLEDADIVSNVFVLLVAGHETTRNLIGSAVYLLLTHPEQFEALRENRALLRGAIEETLRFEPPATAMQRLATEDIEIGGETIQKGDMVYLLIGSANRDPERFPNPEEFDITRKPGKHLAFGSGNHYCVGAILAHLEAELALNALLDRFPELSLDPDRPVKWVHSLGQRGPTSLPALLAK